jgi:hypothetical protein
MNSVKLTALIAASAFGAESRTYLHCSAQLAIHPGTLVPLGRQSFLDKRGQAGPRRLCKNVECTELRVRACTAARPGTSQRLATKSIREKENGRVVPTEFRSEGDGGT